MAVTLSTKAASILFIQRVQQGEGNIYWLKILCLGVCDIASQRSDRTSWGSLNQAFAGSESGRINSCQPAHRNRFNISLNSRYLPSEEHVRSITHLQGWFEHPR